MLSDGRRALAAAAFVALGGACVAEHPSAPPDEPALERADQELIWDPESWDSIVEFRHDPDYHVGAALGRAVADIGCSAFLIDDDILVTAHHCRPDPLGPIVARFGKYGLSPNDYTLAQLEARAALRDRVGLPRSTAFSTAIPDAALTDFTCDLAATEFDNPPGSMRDIDYWRCRPNPIVATIPPFDRERTLQLLPGHVWGHIPVELGSRPDNTPLTLLSTNTRNDFPEGAQPDVLLSPLGKMYNPDTARGGYNKQFDFVGADSTCGSSGGPILDRRTHRVFGVLKGAFTLTMERCPRGEFGRNDSSYLVNKDIGNYLGPVATDFANAPATTTRVPTYSIALSPWVGGSGGNALNTLCPARFLAAGVVGTVESSGGRSALGNFGIVCLPYERTQDALGWDLPASPQLDRATVIAGGSHEIGSPVSNADLTEYIAHRVRPGSFAAQHLSMCPAGSYLSGLEVTVDGVLRSAPRIRCTEITTWTSYWPTPRTYVNERSTTIRTALGSTTAGSPARSECGPKSLVSGLNIRAGSVTDGLRFVCTHLFE